MTEEESDDQSTHGREIVLEEVYVTLQKLMADKEAGRNWITIWMPGFRPGVEHVDDVIAAFRRVLEQGGGSRFLDILDGRQKDA